MIWGVIRQTLRGLLIMTPLVGLVWGIIAGPVWLKITCGVLMVGPFILKIAFVLGDIWETDRGPW